MVKKKSGVDAGKKAGSLIDTPVETTSPAKKQRKPKKASKGK